METTLQEVAATMTELLFGAGGAVLAGYLIGKLFIKLNPLLMLLGGFFLLFMSPVVLQLENRDFITTCLVIGGILNFNRPLTYVRNVISNSFATLRLRKLSAGYVSNLEEQKQEFERDLYEQKRQVEDELKRQKSEAEQDIQRQRHEAEEVIKREAENLKAERERYSQEQQNNQRRQQKQNQQQSNSQQSSNSQSSDNNRYLNPLIFEDACKILGLNQGKTLKEYKAAYLKLMKLYHSDKLSGLPDELRKQEEEKAKTLNVAWGTIKKKLK